LLSPISSQACEFNAIALVRASAQTIEAAGPVTEEPSTKKKNEKGRMHALGGRPRANPAEAEEDQQTLAL